MHVSTLKNRGGSTGRDLYIAHDPDDRGRLRLSAELTRTAVVGATATADWTDDEELRAAIWLGRIVLSIGVRGRLAATIAKRIGRPIDHRGSAESTLGVRLYFDGAPSPILFN